MFATADWDDPIGQTNNMLRKFSGFRNKILYIESLGLRSPKIKSKKDISRIFKENKGVSCLLIGSRK